MRNRLYVFMFASTGKAPIQECRVKVTCTVHKCSVRFLTDLTGSDLDHLEPPIFCGKFLREVPESYCRTSSSPFSSLGMATSPHI